MKSYKVLAALKEDLNSPSVWVKDNTINKRTLAKISSENGKSIWVEIQVLDDNYKSNYNNQKTTINIEDNEHVVVVNQWYRNKLDLVTKQIYNLKIEPNKNSFLFPFRQMQAALKHPDSSVRICADLAIVSVFLGMLGLVIGIIK